MFLENTEVTLRRMLIEIWTVKAMEEAPERNGDVLETRGRAFLVMRWSRTWMNCV